MTLSAWLTRFLSDLLFFLGLATILVACTLGWLLPSGSPFISFAFVLLGMGVLGVFIGVFAP